MKEALLQISENISEAKFKRNFATIDRNFLILGIDKKKVTEQIIRDSDGHLDRQNFARTASARESLEFCVEPNVQAQALGLDNTKERNNIGKALVFLNVERSQKWLAVNLRGGVGCPFCTA